MTQIISDADIQRLTSPDGLTLEERLSSVTFANACNDDGFFHRLFIALEERNKADRAAFYSFMDRSLAH